MKKKRKNEKIDETLKLKYRELKEEIKLLIELNEEIEWRMKEFELNEMKETAKLIFFPSI